VAAQTLGGTTTAVMPRVNLLPPEIAEKHKVRKAQLAMVATGLAAVAVVGVMYTQQSAKVSQATEAKTEALAKTTQLNQQLADLRPVQDAYAQVDLARSTLASAMAYDVQWSQYLHDLTLRIPDNVWLTSYTVKLDPAAAAAAAPGGGTGPVLDPGLGTVTFTGVAFTHDDVAAWLESLGKQKGYANAYFTSAVEALIGEHKVVNFTTTTQLTDKALWNRYTKTKGLAR
jgi:Tfp pilus assembly protein PilN